MHRRTLGSEPSAHVHRQQAGGRTASFAMASLLCLASLVQCRENPGTEVVANEALAQQVPPELENEPREPSAPDAKGWNHPDVRWVDLDVGLERMANLGRPGMLVVKAEWCPRCREYKALFKKPELIELSQRFEMILIDQETSPEAAQRFLAGSYVPRTLFLTRSGNVDSALVGPNPKYPHFFSHQSERQLLATMKRALDGSPH